MKQKQWYHRVREYFSRTVEFVQNADLYYRLLALFLAIILWLLAGENL